MKKILFFILSFVCTNVCMADGDDPTFFPFGNIGMAGDTIIGPVIEIGPIHKAPARKSCPVEVGYDEETNTIGFITDVPYSIYYQITNSANVTIISGCASLISNEPEFVVMPSLLSGIYTISLVLDSKYYWGRFQVYSDNE